MSDALPLMPVAEALRRILAGAEAGPGLDEVALERAAGRTLARDIVSRRTQPPFAASAMDGYAVRAADVASPPTRLDVLGASLAGRAFAGAVGPGQAVRIFTGAPVPAGADAVLIQENTRPENGAVVALEAVAAGRNLRPEGHDFRIGDVGLRAGRRLGAVDLALAAGMNVPVLPVTRKPLVAILATGDELVPPGQQPGPDQIVASNHVAVAAMVEAAGGTALDLGIAPDRLEALVERFEVAQRAGARLLVTIGGASVGDHDLVQQALVKAGLRLDFWRLALRPGKPLMHGHLGAMRVLGLPGNPVSAVICGLLFVVPLVRALSGDPEAGADPTRAGVLGAPVPANDARQDYVRARSVPGPDGEPRAVIDGRQDSSLLSVLSGADCLVLRPPHAPPAAAGDTCRIIDLRRFGL